MFFQISFIISVLVIIFHILFYSYLLYPYPEI
nr:MAG TPA: hypothetical protein [Caudoviricetes sp.]